MFIKFWRFIFIQFSILYFDHAIILFLTISQRYIFIDLSYRNGFIIGLFQRLAIFFMMLCVVLFLFFIWFFDNIWIKIFIESGHHLIAQIFEWSLLFDLLFVVRFFHLLMFYIDLLRRPWESWNQYLGQQYFIYQLHF